MSDQEEGVAVEQVGKVDGFYAGFLANGPVSCECAAYWCMLAIPSCIVLG